MTDKQVNKPKGLRYEVKKDSKGDWRWTFYAKNGEPMAVSTEGYVNQSDCLHAIEVFKSIGSVAPIFVEGRKGG